MASRSFGDERSRKAHLVDGKGGVAGEVDDLRGDVDDGFEAMEAELDGVAAQQPVRMASDSALNACTAAGTGVGKTLTQDTAAAETIDGVTPVVGDRVLLTDQVAGEDNGIYTITVVGTGGVEQVLTRATDADTDAKVRAGMTVVVEEGSANEHTMWMLTTDNPIVLDTDSLTFGQFATSTHAASHITGGGDEVDGDHVDITLTPSNYTPTTSPAEASDVDHLAAHLGGIDDELVDVGQSEGSTAYALLVQSGQVTTLDLLVIGADTYEIDGTGGNINVTIGGTAELTLDAILAAAIASGTEDLLWAKESGTVLSIQAADAPQGSVVAGSPSIVLDTSGMANWVADVGDVNMNTLAGKDAGKQVFCATNLTITADMVTATSVVMAFPFTPTVLLVSVFDSSGALKIAMTDTIVITGDTVVIGCGSGTDIDTTDVVHLVAYA